MASKKNYIKHKRKLIGSVSSITGFIYSHYFTESIEWDSEAKKHKPNGTFTMTAALTFIFAGSTVVIHSNHDDIDKSFKAYVDKVQLIKQMCVDTMNHIKTGKGPFTTRNFLNDDKNNDGFGATLFITADPDDKGNYCIFEISSCYKKFRHGTTLVPMKKYLQSVIDFITEEEKDLEVMDTMISAYIAERKDDGK